MSHSTMRQGLPPTPSSSTDIKAQDGTSQLAHSSTDWDLPEPALRHVRMAPSPPSETTYTQPSETVKSRRRSAAKNPADSLDSDFTLPPPPTRSRKIIQMKPQGEEPTGKGKGSKGKVAVSKAAAAAAAPVVEPESPEMRGAKRKAPGASTAAGRKSARKTAHSIIERRRRSKMNEEFATLKDMVPACNSGDMHKLTILQATIDYLRYLQDCVDKLQVERKELLKPNQDSSQNQLPSIREAFSQQQSTIPPSSQPVSPTTFTSYATSPALTAQDAGRHHSLSSTSTEQRPYGYGTGSAGPSPALGPQMYGMHGMAALALTTPPLRPQSDLDQEASAALLMLNSDRRASTAGRGLSVRDLLSK